MGRPRLVTLSGGRVTSRDSTLHASGELIRATDAYYKQGDPAPWKIRGRVAFNSSPEAASIIGLRYLQFDGATNRFISFLADGTLRIAPATALTGAFSTLEAGLDPGSTTLDTCHYNNNHILFLGGVNRNRVVSSAATIQKLGMLANTVPLGYASTGVGAGFVLNAGKRIFYWAEERVKSGTTVLKRNGESGVGVTTVTGTGATIKPVLTHTQVDPEATHWALFATGTDGAFPAGFEIAEVAIATTTIEDTRSGTDPGAPAGSSYDTVSVTIGLVATLVAKNGPSPISTTGDVFEDRICLNDASDKSKLWFSELDNIHSYSYINFIRFETKEADEITLIRRLGQILIVGLKDSIWRISTLPTASDAQFTPERVKSQVEGAFGVAGTKAACLFSFGQGLRLAYVSPQGLIVTDGYNWDVLTDDVDWEGEVDITRLAESELVNNRREYRLEFSYVNLAGQRREMFLHYHPSHAKLGSAGGLRAKCTWPINRDPNCKTLATIGSQYFMLGGGSDGVAYVHDLGTSEPVVQGGIQFDVETGDVYVAGLGYEAKVDRLMVHHRAYPNQTIQLTLTSLFEGMDDATNGFSVPLDRRESTTFHCDGLADAYRVRLQNSDQLGQISINFINLDLTPTGKTESP